MKSDKDILLKYLPEESVPTVLDWIGRYNLKLSISKSRVSKLGDYRPPVRQRHHSISVNYDLNKYHFLITFVHEFAHLITWEKYKGKVKPHGKEWKEEFKTLMQSFIDNENIFPEDIRNALIEFFNKPSRIDTNLVRILKKYNLHSNETVLEDLPEGAVFKIYNGIVFQKQKKLRKRFRCKRLDDGRVYLVSPLMTVEVVEEN
jgi:hypothetical protein